MGVRAKVWNRQEYDRLVASGGMHADARVQLIQGEIIEMAPQGAAHATAILMARKLFDDVFAGGFVVRTQLPLALGEWSEPEPDVAVVRGTIQDYRDRHPETAVLVVEIADTTLEFDRTRKQQIYAAAGIPDYWVVNLIDRVLEVYRDPRGQAYQNIMHLGPAEPVSPLAAPRSTIRVAALLP